MNRNVWVGGGRGVEGKMGTTHLYPRIGGQALKHSGLARKAEV